MRTERLSPSEVADRKGESPREKELSLSESEKRPERVTGGFITSSSYRVIIQAASAVYSNLSPQY